MAYQMLDPFTYLQPGPFISKYQDWITFTLLLLFFISVTGLALTKRFPGNRYLKPVIISVGLAMAVGTYYGIYRGWLHIGLESLGLFGAALVFTIVFFVLFGLTKGFGMHTWNALPLSYSLFYIGLWAVSPNIFDTISERIPIVNGIMLILFIASIIKTVSGFFHHSRSPEPWALDLKRNRIIPADTPEIKDQIKTEEKEQKSIKKQSIKLTKKDLKNVDQIIDRLKEIYKILSKEQNLGPEVKKDIIDNLQTIRKVRVSFQINLEALKKFIEKYKTTDTNQAAELQKRYRDTKDKTKQAEIKKEYIYEQKKLDIMNFLNANADNINSSLKLFDSNLDVTINYMRAGDIRNAILQVRRTIAKIEPIKDILKKMKHYEIQAVKLSKREESIMKNEAQGK